MSALTPQFERTFLHLTLTHTDRFPIHLCYFYVAQMNWYALTDSAILQALGQSLQRMRLNQDVSQLELVKRTGLSRRTVSEVENGRPASLKTFVQLLRALRLDVLDGFETSTELSPLQAARLLSQQRHRASRREETDL
jgi:DNA-binding XRE family transcriptional regulator